MIVLKNYLVFIFACLLMITSAACKKKTGVNEDLKPDNQKPVDFMSTKAGSYWKYGSRDGIAFTRYARERDTVMNGLTYSYYERQDDGTGTISPEFFGKNGEYHYTLIDLDGNRTSYLPYAYWKDSAKAGDKWDNVGDVYHPATGNVQLQVKSTQISDGLSISIGSQSFTNVIHVHSDLIVTMISTKIGTFDIWFAKGIGVIREEANIDVISAYTQTHTDSLLSYHIAQ